MIQAKIIADSTNEFGNRITTMVVTFPRFILAEFNTHRMFSRNSASSRAIPFEKMVKSVQDNPFIPIAWQKDHKGMQGTEYFTDIDVKKCEQAWLHARDWAVSRAEFLSNNDVTKQLCNRLLESFMWHTVIITATEFENFFALRCPQYVFHNEENEYKFRSRKDVIKQFGEEETVDYTTGSVMLKDLDNLQWLKLNIGQAEIHMMALAEAMWDVYQESIPKQLKADEWHIPFGDIIDYSRLYQVIRDFTSIASENNTRINDTKVKIATAMCARVSYTVVGEEDKPVNYENDIKLHDRLASSGHWSPFEHCAKAMTKKERETLISGYAPYEPSDADGYSYEKAGILGWSGNFRGFVQYRKTFNNENITTS